MKIISPENNTILRALFCLLSLVCFLFIMAFGQTFAQEEIDEFEIPAPQPLGTIFERAEGTKPILEGEKGFTFGEGEGQYSFVFRPDFSTDLGAFKRFTFLPKMIKNVIKVPENEVAFLSRSITLEEDPSLKEGLRLTKMDFPSFYWGRDTPIIIEKIIAPIASNQEGNAQNDTASPLEVDEVGAEDIEENTTPQYNVRDIPKRAVWVRKSDLWQKHPKLFLDRLEGLDIDKIFLEIEIDKQELFPKNSVQIEMFNKAAHKRGFKVRASFNGINLRKNNWEYIWGLQGKATQNFNASVGAASKFDGIQFDVKPHLIEGFDLTNASWQAGFLESISTLKSLSGNLKIHLSLPSWVSGFGEGEFISERLPEFIGGLTVLSFKTERLDINKAITPFLNWGERHNKEILVGLEAGEPQLEKRRRYIKNQTGRVLLTPINGEYYLMFFNENMAIPRSDLYSLVQYNVVSNEGAGFFGRLGTLFEILPILENDMVYFLTFQGIALNGLPDF